MRLRLVFIWLVLASSGCFAQLKVTVFSGLNLGCDTEAIPLNSLINAGSIQVGMNIGIGLCLFNTGTNTITLTSIAVDNAEFSTAANTVPVTIQPGQSTPLVVGVLFTPASAGTKTAQLTLADDATGSPQTFMLNGRGFTDFGLNVNAGLGASITRTVIAGQFAGYNMLVLGATSPPGPAFFNGVVSFSCSNLPPGASCDFTPVSLSLVPGNEFGTFAFNLNTTAASAALQQGPRFKLWYGLAAMFALALVPRRRLRRVCTVCALATLGMTISCGSNTPPTPTPPGTYQFLVNGSSGGVTRSIPMIVVVK